MNKRFLKFQKDIQFLTYRGFAFFIGPFWWILPKLVNFQKFYIFSAVICGWYKIDLHVLEWQFSSFVSFTYYHRPFIIVSNDLSWTSIIFKLRLGASLWCFIGLMIGLAFKYFEIWQVSLLAVSELYNLQ